MTREDLDFIGSMAMRDEISDEAYKKIVCHFEGREQKAEQEPCEDCISRRAVINAIYANSVGENEYNLTSSRIKKAVEELPSVNPQKPKPGHWINEDVNGIEYYRCSECRSSPWDSKTKCCPDCGCRMIEPKKSEG